MPQRACAQPAVPSGGRPGRPGTPRKRAAPLRRAAQRGAAPRQPALDAPAARAGRAARCAPCRPCRAPAAPAGPGRCRRGRARTARRPGCRWRRAPRATARSRSAIGLSSSAASPAIVEQRVGLVPAQHAGQRARRCAAWRAGRPGRSRPVPRARAQAVNAAGRRRPAGQRGPGLPRGCACPASQLRSTSRSSAAGLARPIRRACSSSAADVTQVGPHRVRGQPALRPEVAGEARPGPRRTAAAVRPRDRYAPSPPRLVAHGRHRDPR